MTVADQIRAKLTEQQAHWIAGYITRLTIGRERAHAAYELSDLGACHDAINAILDQYPHASLCIHAIAKALNIPVEEPPS